ncbi:5-formyltetrahydrofolate cyclo-ligase [Citricoccus alkalitolerans]|uniref:5-formyltetrahydrofolate cyclo-ligase n=1 Tax=Citricoccus alkalitolerans TaxID=246603 RepID=A0ABV8XRZ9_9MICC
MSFNESFSQPASSPPPEGGETQYSASLTGNRGESPEEVLKHRKQDFRTLWRARRRELDPSDRAAQSADLTSTILDWYLPRAQHRRVAAVLSYGAEPDTGPLLEALHGAGVEVLVPITEPERQLSWTAWHPGVEVARSSVAPIDEPVGERLSVETMETVDLVLVPAQAVDTRGFRLGQGGGYYDRFLAALYRQRAASSTSGDSSADATAPDDGPAPSAVPVTVAVVFRHELMTRGEVPISEFDEAVDGAVTADGFTWFGQV